MTRHHAEVMLGVCLKLDVQNQGGGRILDVDRHGRGGVLKIGQFSWTSNVRNVHRRTQVLESLFNTIAVQKVCNFIKKRLQLRCFPVNIEEIFKNSYFYGKPRVVVSRCGFS